MLLTTCILNINSIGKSLNRLKYKVNRCGYISLFSGVSEFYLHDKRMVAPEIFEPTQIAVLLL